MPELATSQEANLDCAQRCERARIGRIAQQLQRHLIGEHEESYALADVERALQSWLELERERLIEDAVELLTEPRFMQANEFRRLLARAAHSSDKLPSAQFTPAMEHLVRTPLAA